MKKMLLTLAGLSIFGSAGASVVSCSGAAFASGEDGQRIMVITDGGNVFDKSFNQSAHEAVMQFTKDKYGINSDDNWVEATDSSITGLMAAYKLGMYKKANTLVIAGFTHASTIARISRLMGPNKTIVMADADAGEGIDNVTSLTYNSELSGFAAGFDAAVWATSDDDGDGHMNGDVSGDGKISFGTFAGISNKFGVDNYNWGFLVGAETFNEVVENPQKQIRFANSQGDVNSIGTVDAGNAKWYTNSFALGGATASGMVTTLLDNDHQADIMFAVAGPQTGDVLTTHARYQPYVVGVDVDQVKSYPDYANRFISSATKNLKKSIYDALDHTSALRSASKDGVLGELHDKNNSWDGYDRVAKQNIDKSSWSINKVGDGNILSSSAIDFENASTSTELEPLKDIAEKIKSYFNGELGVQAKEYMNTNAIKTMVKILLDEHKDFLTNLTTKKLT